MAKKPIFKDKLEEDYFRFLAMAILTLLLLWCATSLGLSLFQPTVHINFSCQGSFYNGQITSIGFLNEYSLTETKEVPVLDSYLNVVYVQPYGTGCDHQRTYTNQTKLHVSMNDLSKDLFIVVEKDFIKINDEKLDPNQSFEITNYLETNFWSTTYLRAKYLGIMPFRDNSSLSRHVLIGTYGGYNDYIKGIIITIILLVLFFLIKPKDFSFDSNLKKGIVFTSLSLITCYLFIFFQLYFLINWILTILSLFSARAMYVLYKSESKEKNKKPGSNYIAIILYWSNIIIAILLNLIV